MKANFPLLLIVWAVLFSSGYAIFEDDGSGVRAEGMGGAFWALADDISAIDFNPAGLAQVQERQFEGFYKLLYSGVDVGLHTVYAGIGIPIKRLGTFGLRVQETGFFLQSQRSIKLAHGFELAEGIFFGYGLNGYNLSQKDYGQGWTAGLDLGMFARVHRFWSAGFYVHNINLPRIGESELPRVLAFGLGFSPTPGIHSTLGFSKEPGMRTRIALGQEFEIIPQYLTLRAGASTEPVSFSFGLGSGVERVRVDYALKTHPVLPLTHNFGVLVKF